MAKVTNNHNAPLHIAGVDVAPGKTVEVADKAFKQWSHGNAARVWLEQGLVKSDTKGEKRPTTKTTTVTTEGGDNGGASTPNAERLALQERAAALGIDFTDETSDEDLTNAVTEAEEEAGKAERETLLKEARDLGLNPNANTSTAKLKEQIAAKKSA